MRSKTIVFVFLAKMVLVLVISGGSGACMSSAGLSLWQQSAEGCEARALPMFPPGWGAAH